MRSVDFACPPVITQSIFERQIGVGEGENATLTCSVDALPITSIQWYSQRRLITNNVGISSNRKFIIHVVSSFELLKMGSRFEGIESFQ